MDVNLKKLNKNVTLNIKVHISKQLKARMWIAKKMFELGAKVLGCSITVTDTMESDGR